MPTPDILVFPAGTAKVFNESVQAAQTLPAVLRERARAGELRIVIDGSSEGVVHDPARSSLLHDLVHSIGAPVAKAVYVTREINYPADYAAWRQAVGDDQRLTILHHDSWIWRFLQPFHTNGAEVLEERKGWPPIEAALQ